KARVVLLSHFDRPEGKFVPSMSLAPLVDVIAQEMNRGIIKQENSMRGQQAAPALSVTPCEEQDVPQRGYIIKFGVDAIGKAAREAVENTQAGEILLLENIRFYEGEEKNDPAFAKELASLGDIF